MVKKAESEAFINCMEARHVRPGYLLCSVADLFKTEWVVQTIMSRVSDRFIIMELKFGGKTVNSAIAPGEFVERKIYKNQVFNVYSTPPPVQNQ